MRLTRKIAKSLLSETGPLIDPGSCLDCYTELDPEAASLLACAYGDLRLDGLATLPDDIALALLVVPREPDIVPFDAAPASERLWFSHLSLKGLGTLSTAAAECIAKSWRSPVYLDGLRSICDGAAEALVAQCGEFSLLGLEGLSDRSAAALGKMAARFPVEKSAVLFVGDALGSILRVREWIESGIHEGTPLASAAAATLSGHTGFLWLDGIRNLSAPAAAALSLHAGDLWMRGLIRLDAPVARLLAAHRGGFMGLDGLRALDDGTALELSKYRGSLSFGRMAHISNSAAESLSMHQGPCLFLNGVEYLSDRAAESLSRYPGELCLDGVENLTVSAAESLSRHRGDHLFLNNLKDPGGKLRPLLMRHPGDLHIDRIANESHTLPNSHFPP